MPDAFEMLFCSNRLVLCVCVYAGAVELRCVHGAAVGSLTNIAWPSHDHGSDPIWLSFATLQSAE
jgi:hypothetical protein